MAKMTSKMVGLVLGLLGILLWFTPWTEWTQDFMGRQTVVFQSGQHIGGLAYLVLLAAGGYAWSAWNVRRQLQLVAAGGWLLVVLLYVVQGMTPAWGLYGLLVTACAGLWRAFYVEDVAPEPRRPSTAE